MTKQDINDFNSRVKRIKNPKNNSYYDPDLQMHIPKKVPRDKIKRKAAGADEESILGTFLVSAIIGAFCLALAQLVRVRYFGLIEAGSVTLFVDLMATLWFMLVLTALIKRTQVGARVAQVIGVVAMLVAGHNLVWRWPEQMAYIYTAEFTNYVQQTTQPPSVVVGATVFAF